jgi:hypothetical protein
MCEAFFPGTARQGRCAEAISIYGEEIAHLHFQQVQVSTGTERRSPLRTGDDVAMTQSKKLRL